MKLRNTGFIFLMHKKKIYLSRMRRNVQGDQTTDTPHLRCNNLFRYCTHSSLVIFTMIFTA